MHDMHDSNLLLDHAADDSIFYLDQSTLLAACKPLILPDSFRSFHDTQTR